MRFFAEKTLFADCYNSAMYPLARRIGHRGLAAHAPENTLAGIRRAHRAGLRWVEFDVRVAADNTAVLSHDASLLRCGGVHARIKRKTAAQLGAIPVSCGFRRCAKECAPTLAAAFLLLRELKMGAVVEIKPDKGNEAAVIRAVAKALPFAPPEMMFSSFSMPVLLEAKRRLPKIPRALNCNRPKADIFPLLRRAAAVNLHCGAQSGRGAIAAAASAGFGVYCFTVDDAREAEILFAAGAHGVFTNTGLNLA